MTPEEAIRRPMVTQSPIAGNLDCGARPFHSELCFDIATFRIQPELRGHFVCYRAIHFTIDERHGILGAWHIAEALHIPYELARPRIFEPRLALHRVTLSILCLEGNPHSITS
ncbi:hypothetical protein CK203_089776 [Vitis vinifera]|uniref:Uncharacterized protein n=1 Tax=Vitis vinifera TaxID=29760 RepID=A0A438BLE9_VITVI|nr:hypothetical protein CK203_089776 [Vitis vinifera]